MLNGVKQRPPTKTPSNNSINMRKDTKKAHNTRTTVAAAAAAEATTVLAQLYNWGGREKLIFLAFQMGATAP